MDESLSDFQEKKKLAGPKNVAKTTAKPKKVYKKIKGQKDIRKVLNLKKNELESYSKDFDKVCKQAGIDVNSEQLQIAIALSKSLQTDSTTSVESQPSSSKERVGKIRSTLLEYGFKVPEIKITKPKRGKNTRKKYKLLQASDSEKQQIIANKYSKLLFEDISCKCCINFDNTKAHLYHLATNATYDVLKNNNIFYVDKLFEITQSTGILLKDWALIPGRPVSPKPSVQNNMNFSEIECSQEKLDIIMSGTHKNCENILKTKTKCIKNIQIHFEIEQEDKTKPKDNLKLITITEDNTDSLKIASDVVNPINSAKTNGVVDLIEIIPSIQCRSGSPDLFDDDINEDDSPKNSVSQKIMQIADNGTILNENHKVTECATTGLVLRFPVINSQVTYRNTNDFMEITSCVENKDSNIRNVTKCLASQFSQKSNATRRRSDDFMEITNCVASAAPTTQECDIDLTESPKSKNDLATNQKGSTSFRNTRETHIDLTQNNTIEIIDVNDTGNNLDLTQSSDNSDELPVVILSQPKKREKSYFTGSYKSNSADETIIMDPNKYENINSKVPDENVLDLTQENDVEYIKSPSGSFFEEFIHNHSDSGENIGNNRNSTEEARDKINLTQLPNVDNISNHSKLIINNMKAHGDKNDAVDLTQIENVNYVYKKSYSSKDDSRNDKSDSIDLTQVHDNRNDNDDFQNNLTQDNVRKDAEQCHDDIDLTQNSDSNESLQKSPDEVINQGDYDQKNMKEHSSEYVAKSSQRYSSLGKRDDVSIDYDDVNQYNGTEKTFNSYRSKSESEIKDNVTKNQNDIEVDLAVINDFDVNYNCSQNSEVFEISDMELNYSINKSKLETPVENFNLGGISILDDLSKADSYRKSRSSLNTEPKDHEKPTIDINNEISPIKHRRIIEICTPQKASSSGTLVETPNNTQFIVKTANVTPMLQYELMSTPQIHRELDKYGIKPFKRKRGRYLIFF